MAPNILKCLQLDYMFLEGRHFCLIIMCISHNLEHDIMYIPGNQHLLFVD